MSVISHCFHTLSLYVCVPTPLVTSPRPIIYSHSFSLSSSLLSNNFAHSFVLCTIRKMPSKNYDEQSDSVPPHDRAEALAMEYENSHHERPGTKKHNETPSHQGKPKSVR
ncbi:conserved hypothetical protein [Leishmania major strain Friedlin]|uniref:Uncharacterized protein n=1 Tax=Leishmania major TaxID=5664 RepID=Q4QF27_LEIMA|nr:conserved hypothetical protein [Leishmania major strain Friedlin]CAG9571621.1 hypothetical_protein-conserved [Leishmania major strain Friedlin]CAJ03383.1 conserved hypothetical protein [Leishmania major strain Friedlin]|eukprot:XP_001682071.1 conserved hypothetical protein [Leishmania major strain Friedlin]